MSKKIWADAGHGNNSDPGAIGLGRLEKDETLKMANAIFNNAAKRGFSVNRSRTGDVVGLNRGGAANSWGAEVFLCIHRNAFGNASANGFETWTPQNQRDRELALANAIQRRCVDVGVQSNRGVKRDTNNAFLLIRNVNADAVLVEYGFITNARDNELFDRNLQAYAEATVQGVIDVYGAPQDSPRPSDTPLSEGGNSPPIVPTDKNLFRVQVGAFQNKSNAERLREELRTKGYKDAFIVSDGVWNRVQVGAFSIKANADRVLDDVRKPGYIDAFIQNVGTPALIPIDWVAEVTRIAKEIVNKPNFGGWGTDPARRNALIVHGDKVFGAGNGQQFRNDVQAQINVISGGR
jgi:N-acetylmuramoyl-L-alanine amidase